MSCFQIGQRVCVTGPITTKYGDRSGIVAEVKAIKQRYTVRFDNSEQVEFYESQLTMPQDFYAEISALPI